MSEDAAGNAATIEPWLLDAAADRLAAFTAQLRSGIDGATKVPNLEWTVADLGQHVACLPNYWSKHELAGASFERPDDFGAFSDAARAHITETSPDALADLIDAEYGPYLDGLRTGPVQRWLYGRATTTTTMGALAVNEAIMHGRDLAAITGAVVPRHTSSEALAAVDATMVTAPAFIDPVRAQTQPDGVYHLRFKGGVSYTWIKQGSNLMTETGRPPKADAHMVADPEMFLLSSLGRVGQVRAALSGKMFTYGKKPWRFLGLNKIVADGV